MPNPTLEFTEGPPGNPPDASQTVAVFGFASLATPGIPQVYDSPAEIPGNAGRGKAACAVHHIVSASKKRTILVPCSPTIPGAVSAVTQIGNGPAITVTVDNAITGAFDDADIEITMSKGGAPGTASFASSWAWVVTNNTPERLRRPAALTPEVLRATVVGTKDLTKIVYAKPATLVGTVDLRANSALYGASGTLAGKTIIVDFDNDGAATLTIGAGTLAPTSAEGLAAALALAAPSGSFTIDPQGRLTIASDIVGALSKVDVQAASTADSILGLSNTPVVGSAGVLDGLTIILDEDTTSSQTRTFPSGSAAVKSPTEIASFIDAAINIDADVYSSSNFLRIRSATKGSASTLSITGGTALSALGLVAANATGADSTYTIEHLGVTITFPTGNYSPGTRYLFTTWAPVPDFDEVALRLADLVTRKIPFGRIHLAFEQDLVTSLANAGSLDGKIGEYEALGVYFSGIVGVRYTELDDDVRTAFLAYRSRRVDKCARGVYLRVPIELVPGGGEILRSSSFSYAERCATLPFWKDPGEHASGPAIGVTGITDDELDTTIKLVELVGADGASWNVLDSGPRGFNFSGGYSSASGVSRYCDKSTRDAVLRMAVIGNAAADAFINATSLDTKADKTIEDASAREVEGAIEKAVREDLVPEAAQAVSITVDQTEPFYDTKRLKYKGTLFNRSPARSVSGIIGPGIIEEAV
jgi:hypothetical protein